MVGYHSHSLPLAKLLFVTEKYLCAAFLNDLNAGQYGEDDDQIIMMMKIHLFRLSRQILPYVWIKSSQHQFCKREVAASKALGWRRLTG